VEAAYNRVVAKIAKSQNKHVVAAGRRLALAKIPGWKETQIAAYAGKRK
jgi:hypothetical protein